MVSLFLSPNVNSFWKSFTNVGLCNPNEWERSKVLKYFNSYKFQSLCENGKLCSTVRCLGYTFISRMGQKSITSSVIRTQRTGIHKKLITVGKNNVGYAFALSDMSFGFQCSTFTMSSKVFFMCAINRISYSNNSTRDLSTHVMHCIRLIANDFLYRSRIRPSFRFRSEHLFVTRSTDYSMIWCTIK